MHTNVQCTIYTLCIQYSTHACINVSVGNGFEYRIEYSILTNSKFLNLTDI